MAMVGFAPPAPRPEMMRAGALSAFASNTGGLDLCFSCFSRERASEVCVFSCVFVHACVLNVDSGDGRDGGIGFATAQQGKALEALCEGFLQVFDCFGLIQGCDGMPSDVKYDTLHLIVVLAKLRLWMLE